MSTRIAKQFLEGKTLVLPFYNIKKENKMRQRRWKYIVVALLVVFAVVLGIRQTHFQSVDSYRQEQKLVRKDLTGDDELSSMYKEESGETQQPELTNQPVSTAHGGKADQKTSDGKEKLGKNTDDNTLSAKADTSSGEPSSKKNTSGKSSDKKGKSSTPGKHSDKNSSGNPSATAGTSGQNATAGQTPGQSDAADASSGGGNGDQASSGQNGTSATPGQSQSSSMATAKPGGSTVTTTPEAEKISCTIEIRCDSLVKNKKQAQESIWKYIPDDGEILAKVTVQMEKGATVYDVLAKACKVKGIAVDAEYTPLYKSYYIKGIAHLYEKQAGDMSGWIYKVNDVAPNRGASAYKISDGDVISWRYTCDGRTT